MDERDVRYLAVAAVRGWLLDSRWDPAALHQVIRRNEVALEPVADKIAGLIADAELDPAYADQWRELEVWAATRASHVSS